ncbi:MAG: glycine cleavage system aminomethyltransferase GcvT [Candidatus Bipolaricaulota bacterium]|nr:glycine cleavage system aminomethyltransferase GcvT [Candidatus Bipolaricaulota bacterium]MCS7275005.1 glycine cleavage system aminomethyltransferase GcvT [Candidatus Bipolaricaulota bacterium]MDW8110530.1 glycine cleavage system aminomethyltransferase GcvT [Candidatus Bipolaricaulota bacterium]MDW8329319.1 glycine cleavage system aminomethyltransferase GcvT [Candidatus Bipolaricaulota bacterium]
MSLKRTPLYEAHKRLGAKMVEFGGWEMPIQYTSIIEEHQTVRRSVGIFDVSHMGEIEISGRGALALVQKLITNDASALADYQVLYSPMCYESGGTVDDLLVYKLPDRFLLVVNAANTEKDFHWVQKNAAAFSDVTVRNASADYAQIAIQGPRAQELLQPLVKSPLEGLKYYWAVHTRLWGESVLLSRTGYTGEDGFEIYISPEMAERLWEELLRAGARPIGLGARDTLRFEASYPLYGHELSDEISPVEAGLGWTVKEKSTDYNGKSVLLAQKRQGASRRLIGLKMLEGGVPRQGYKIFAVGIEVGWVTSGMYAPTLEGFLAMGLVSSSVSKEENFEIEIRGERRRAQRVPLPFYRRPR